MAIGTLDQDYFLQGQWQCSVTSTTTDFFHPNKKNPVVDPKTTANPNHTLYVMNINIRK